jgi:hypothetical protein
MKQSHLKGLCAGLALAFTLTVSNLAWSSSVPTNCRKDGRQDNCTWEILVDGQVVDSGTYEADRRTGEIIMDELNIAGDGYEVNLQLNGNIDPILGFGLGAKNTSGGLKTFAFAFSLPLGGLPTPIASKAELGTTFSAFTSNGGSVFPTLGTGTIVDSQDIRINPFANVDKGVDIGAGLSLTGQGTAVNIENATGLISTGGPFDLMSVTVAFGLTDQTGVGFSGFVEQTPVPVPAAVWLFGTGFIGLLAAARRRKA